MRRQAEEGKHEAAIRPDDGAETEMSQAQAAKLFDVTQPRISDLMRGKINLFGLDALVNMVTAAGLHIEMRVLEAA
jgi:predicted XRE-type DNA-binding protein